jgi:thiosulfate dehydrogenase (quinone) large subunit
MNELNETKKTAGGEAECCGCDQTLAFLVLRGWLAVRAIFTGIEKFGAYQSVAKPVIDPATGQPDASGVMINVNVKHYALANYSGIPAGLKDKFTYEPLLPKFAVTAFDHLLGPAFILTGIMLLIGLGTRLSLFMQGLIYITLTIGLILIRQDDGISWLGIHIALVAFALTLARHNKFALLKKW